MNIKVAFLFDKQNDWIFSFFKDFNFERNNFSFYKFFETDKLIDFDIVFLLGYTKILSNEFLKKNKLTLVIHESDLPNGKGFSPLQWQIIQGKSEIIFSLIKASEKVDSGDIFLQSKVIFDGTELYEEIRKKQAEATKSLIIKFLNDYPYNKSKKQEGSGYFFLRRTKADGELNISKTLEENFNLLRIGNNDLWPSFFYFRGVKYVIKIYKENNID